jgi:hypothetical protein
LVYPKRDYLSIEISLLSYMKEIFIKFKRVKKPV